MPVELVGRTHYQYGKRLWEIIGSLKNFGVGRMVVQSTYERYPEPCYYRILSARPDMDTGRPFYDEDNLKGKVLVEKVFRGIRTEIHDLSRSAYKTDFKLIPKHEEYKYLEAFEKFVPPKTKLFPATMEMPPLLKIIAERDNHKSREIKLMLKNGSNYRVVKEGETPNVDLPLGLGIPPNPKFYKDVMGDQ